MDKGIESLKTAQQQLKVYRQAVLKWAFEGKLTNKNVVEGELPEGWKYEDESYQKIVMTFLVVPFGTLKRGVQIKWRISSFKNKNIRKEYFKQ